MITKVIKTRIETVTVNENKLQKVKKKCQVY